MQLKVENLNRLAADLVNEQVTLQNSLNGANNRVKEIQSRLGELDGLLATSDILVNGVAANLATVKEACASKDVSYNEQ